MSPSPIAFWHADIELACPATWPYDRLSYVTAALAANRQVITSKAAIARTGRRYSITASMLIKAETEPGARALARTVLEQACAIGRLPTGALISSQVKAVPLPGTRG